jgi:flagellar assembly protein FliH
LAKIIKYNTVNVDNTNIVNIELPTFEIETETEAEEIQPEQAEEETEEELSEQEAQSRSSEILEMARIQSESMIYNAEQEARDIVEKAKIEAKAECEKVYNEYMKNGYDDGYNAGKAESERLVEEAKRYREETERERKKTIDEIEPMVIRLAMRTVENILAEASPINPNIIACLIRKGLSDTKIYGDIFIHVPEEHYSEILKRRTELGLDSDSNAKIEIVKDMSLKSGDCIIETPFGNIDCSIDVQFSAIKENMMYLLSGR